MEKKYWFKPANYGYKLVPICWQGWLATLVFIGFCVLAAYTDGLFSTETISLVGELRFALDLFILIMLLLVWAKDKTEGELKWYWGNRDKK